MLQNSLELRKRRFEWIAKWVTFLSSGQYHLTRWTQLDSNLRRTLYFRWHWIGRSHPLTSGYTVNWRVILFELFINLFPLFFPRFFNHFSPLLSKFFKETTRTQKFLSLECVKRCQNVRKNSSTKSSRDEKYCVYTFELIQSYTEKIISHSKNLNQFSLNLLKKFKFQSPKSGPKMIKKSHFVLLENTCQNRTENFPKTSLIWSI